MVKAKEFLLHTFVTDFLDANSVVFDLGSNKGEFAEYIVSKFSSKVIAVEPILELYGKIKSTPNIKKLRYGVNHTGDSCTFYLETGACATTHEKNDVKTEKV